jgi:hypothetical protein
MVVFRDQSMTAAISDAEFDVFCFSLDGCLLTARLLGPHVLLRRVTEGCPVVSDVATTFLMKNKSIKTRFNCKHHSKESFL